MTTTTQPPRLDATLDDKYTLDEGICFMTGIQALVRIALEQRKRDQAAGHNTGGYISGYQGSPLAAYDGALRKIPQLLKENNIVYRPGVNEELAATAVWGSQYVGMFKGAQVDGVFGIWFGKGPGVDRSVDALRHANWAGTSPLGGTLALAGDDHGAKSSTVACYSDIVFESMAMPVLYPSNVQEILEFGLHGIAMSRFSGAWTGMKLVGEIVESAGTVQLDPTNPPIVLPEFEMPADGLSIRPAEMVLMPVEERVFHKRLYAALAYAKANHLNRIVFDPDEASIGIVSAGKAWQDVRKALFDLGIDEKRAAELGVRTLQLGMVWPVEPDIVRQFARGLKTVIVVEEKRPLVEQQVRSILYGTDNAPKVIGKVRDGYIYDASREWVFPNFGEITPQMIAALVAELLADRDPSFAQWQAPLSAAGMTATPPVLRTPSFCSGCPHNRSTKLPAGSRTLAGIGCHGMQVFLDPENCKTVAQMGGEGMHWLGQQPFTSEKHVFANLGDGTYAHSGSLAIRQAVAAGVPITYKLLANGFVSMTGGQPIQGGQTLPQMVDALRADGVERIVVVTDDTEKYASVKFADGVPVKHRSELEAVQMELREYPGVSVLIYEQPCATERRRLRKQGKWEDPQKRTFINSAVCEGCGDCGKVSTCLSIEPLETEFGRKRRINQSSCNKDFSCVEGFCPSFVTVHGGSLRKPGKAATKQKPEPFELPEPVLPDLSARSQPFNVLVGGIGGTGVITIGQVLGVAAYIDGTHLASLDMMGMSQKYGAVFSHLHFAASADQLTSPRIDAGEADTLIGCDLIVASGIEPVAALSPGRSHAVICSDLIATAEFARNADWSADGEGLLGRIRAGTGEALTVVDGQRLANSLLGDSIASNMMMVGVAWQLGRIPLSRAAIERAIELNGVQIEMNRKAFEWGRCIAVDPARVERMLSGGQVIQFHRKPAPPTLDELVARRVEFLTEYQNAALAKRYRELVDRVAKVDAGGEGKQALAVAVAQSWFKLLAVKDEWEVARLYTSENFRKELEQTFEGEYKLHFHIGGWPFAKKDPTTGKISKREVGPWLMSAFKLMAPMRKLRGTMLDPFRNNEERRLERDLVATFERDMQALLAGLKPENYDTAVAIASLPMKVRGYGHVKKANADNVAAERERLMNQFNNPVTQVRRAG